MQELINELQAAENVLRQIKVDGEYWLYMSAVCNSIGQVRQKLQEMEVGKDESINNGSDA